MRNAIRFTAEDAEDAENQTESTELTKSIFQDCVHSVENLCDLCVLCGETFKLEGDSVVRYNFPGKQSKQIGSALTFLLIQ
jgi:hypothetical protein